MQDYRDITRAVFENIDFVAWACDTGGVLQLQEGRGLRALGLAPGQLVGTNIFELYADDPAMMANARRALGGESIVFVSRVHGRVLENRLGPYRDERGEVVGAVGISTDITDRSRVHDELQQQAATLREQTELLDLAHDGILVRGLDGAIRYWNRGAERLYGFTQAEALGVISHSLLRTEFPADRAELERSLQANGYLEVELTHTRSDGRKVIVASRWVLRRGDVDTVLELNTDITARREAEAEQARRREEVIRAQAQAIEELSTPLIPITDDVLVMPLIGLVDSMRVKQVMDSLLGGLATSRGRVAILDITGVPVVDTQVANALIEAAHAVRLLGAEVVITGIRPEVAQTLVSIGVDLGRIVTRGTLQSGIQYALGRDGFGGAARRGAR